MSQLKIRILAGSKVILDKELRLDDPAEFAKHKEDIIDSLRDAHKRGHSSTYFDVDKVCDSLAALARGYLAMRKKKQTKKSAADRIERLRDIAKILSRACRLVDRTVATDIGSDLFSAWWEVAGSEHIKPNGTFDPRYMDQKFREQVKSLEALAAAASYAADHVLPGTRGKPPVLSQDDIWNLATVYRDSTGRKPSAGDGPFAKFVMKFLGAVGRRDDIDYDSLVEAIKRVRRWALKDRKALKWGPSPFD
jgi:hypothetical protein